MIIRITDSYEISGKFGVSFLPTFDLKKLITKQPGYRLGAGLKQPELELVLLIPRLRIGFRLGQDPALSHQRPRSVSSRKNDISYTTYLLA